MAKVETKTATAVELELPPIGGNISIALDDDAHYLRVTLDKSENFKIAAGEKLCSLLANQFNNNRDALRDWYEDNVTQGKAHRAWSTVEKYLTVVRKYGDEAERVLEEREAAKREKDYEYAVKHGRIKSPRSYGKEIKEPKSEYDIRAAWLSDMNVLWFKGDREWQDRWLKDRGLSRLRGI